MKRNKRIKEYIRETWEFRSKITVEPFVICYILPSVLAGLAVQNLLYEKSCVVNLNYDVVTCRHIMQGRTANYSVQEKNVQAMVATVTAWSYPLQTALPGILMLFLGAWSDRTGNRKAFMMLPIIGKIIGTLGVILSTVFFFQVGVSETAIIDGVLPALTGGRVAMTMAVYSYITDITNESERTFRLGIITATLTLSRPIGLALSGYMTRRFGYYGMFTGVCVFYVVGFIYIVLRLKPTTKKTVDNEEKQSCFSMFCLSDLVATVNVAFKRRKGTRRMQIFLILFAYLLIVGPVLGESPMTYWFTRYKFKFTEVDYSLFLAYSVLVGTIAASVVNAVAPTRSVYFLGPVLDMFSSAGATSLRSMASKLVHSDEI
ncbi:Adenylate cyclase, partial [Operophtera brumata]